MVFNVGHWECRGGRMKYKISFDVILAVFIMNLSTTLKLNDGNEMPIFGLGTWQSNSGEVSSAIKAALDYGYRLLDCAHVYQNQPDIGEALTKYFKSNEKNIQRKDVFITSKVWNTYHSYEAAVGEIDLILKELNLNYIDLILIHWPMGFKEGTGEWFPQDPSNPSKVLFSDVDYLETWRALEAKLSEGKILSIGVSNFGSAQIRRILDVCKTKPAVNQVELHPFFQQKELREFCKREGIILTAYSPLGNPGGLPEAFRKKDDPSIFIDPTLSELAKKYNKTNAQVALRGLIQLGVSVIPKSVNANRIRENADIFDFELDAEEMRRFEALDCGRRFVDLWARDGHHPHFPWQTKE